MRSKNMNPDTASIRQRNLWSLLVAMLAAACPQAHAQVNCAEGLGLPDTLWHCSNDPLAVSPATSPCLSAFSLELDGNNDRAQWNADEAHLLGGVTGSFSLTSWWRMEEDPNNDLQFMWEEGDANIGWNLHLDGDSLRAGWWNEGDSAQWISAFAPAEDWMEWTHVAVVGHLDSATLTVYVNQEAVGTTGWFGLNAHPGTAVLGAAGTSQLSNGDAVQPGGGGGGGGGGTPFEWSGWTDEVGYWSAPLDSLERLEAANCPLNVEAGLEAAWLFEPAPDYAAWDFTGQGWNGFLAGSDLVDETPDVWPEAYAWSNGSENPGLLLEFGGGGGGDDEGWYALTVTYSDSTVCTDSTFVVDWNPNIQATVVQPTCFGGSDGSVTAVLDGGTPPYSLTINNGADPTALDAGNYQIQVTDANGCDDNQNVQVLNPEGMEWSFTVTPDDCSENPVGTATLDTITSVNGPVTLDFGGQDLLALPNGTLQLVATDSAGCSQDIDVNIPLDLSTCSGCTDIDLVPDTVWNCFQGPMVVTAANLDCPNLFAAYFDGGNDRVELGHAQDGGGGPGGGNATPASPLFEDEVIQMTISVEFNPIELEDQHILYMEGDEDAGLALYLDGSTLWGGWWDENSANPEGVWASIDGASTDQWQRAGWSCNASTGELWVALEGVGFSTLSFSDTLGIHPGGGVIGATGDIRLHDGESQAGGGGGPGGGGWNHEFEGWMDHFAIWDTAMDTSTWAGVTFCPEVTLESNLMAHHSFESDAGDVSIDEGYAHVNGEFAGSDIEALENGGNAYLWSNGSTEPYAFLNGSGQGNTYTVLFNDGTGGCVDTVVVVDWNPQAAVAELVMPSCFDSQDGSAVLTLDAGQAPYTWNVFGEAFADSLTEGNYTAEVMDANGCSDLVQFELVVDIPWEVDIVVDPLLCLDDASATAQAEATGLLGPWLYAWNGSPASASGAANNLSAGTQTLTVTDNNGCSATFDVEVETGEQTLYTLVTVTPPPCVGEGGGIAFLGVSGGAQPYEADWFGINPMDIPPGTYSVLVTDGNGCEVEDEFVIPETGTLELAAEATNISCFGALDGSIELEAIQSNGDLILNWDGAGDAGANVSAGDYTITAVDALGCTDTLEVTIAEPNPVAPGTITGPNADLETNTIYDYTLAANLPPGWTVNWDVSGGSVLSVDGEGASIIWTEGEAAAICATLTDNNGCTSDVFCLDDGLIFTGIEAIDNVQLLVFPQPANGQLNVQWSSQAEPGKVAVYSNLGQLIHRSQWASGKTTLDVSMWPAGLYHLVLNGKNGISRMPVMVQ
ncbi:MAG: T9SS type A sorting domain-containing protein [Flavobacteriales bacterium]|nr:T9SS type A sorting domain-containing protein [Flavobacteriales bacterium]